MQNVNNIITKIVLALVEVELQTNNLLCFFRWDNKRYNEERCKAYTGSSCGCSTREHNLAICSMCINMNAFTIGSN